MAYEKDLFYDSEDSENEVIRRWFPFFLITQRELNAIGNVPIEWYDDYDHVGYYSCLLRLCTLNYSYDLEGKKVGKRTTEGEIDRMLALEKHPWYIELLSSPSSHEQVSFQREDWSARVNFGGGYGIHSKYEEWYSGREIFS